MEETNKRLTRYQLELIELVRAGVTEDGQREDIDFDQLIDTLSWKPTKASAHFSIRALVKRDLLQKNEALTLRRGRQRVTFRLTTAGQALFDPRIAVDARESLPALVSSEMDDFSLPEIDSTVI